MGIRVCTESIRARVRNLLRLLLHRAAGCANVVAEAARSCKACAPPSPVGLRTARLVHVAKAGFGCEGCGTLRCWFSHHQLVFLFELRARRLSLLFARVGCKLVCRATRTAWKAGACISNTNSSKQLFGYRQRHRVVSCWFATPGSRSFLKKRTASAPT